MNFTRPIFKQFVIYPYIIITEYLAYCFKENIANFCSYTGVHCVPDQLIMYQLVCIPVICIVVFCMMFNAKNSKRMGYDHMRLVLHIFSHTSVAAF